MRSTGRSSGGRGECRRYRLQFAEAEEMRAISTASLIRVSIDELIRGRRTHKAYAPEPVDRTTLEALFELARWAPNHNLTNPWRFRVLGPQALAALKQAAGPEAAAKLDPAPTLVAASPVRAGGPVQDEEDFAAAAAAPFIPPPRAPPPGPGGNPRP